MSKYTDLDFLWPIFDSTKFEHPERMSLIWALYQDVLQGELNIVGNELAQSVLGTPEAISRSFAILILKEDKPEVWLEAVAHERKRERKSKELMDKMKKWIENPPGTDALVTARRAAMLAAGEVGVRFQQEVKNKLDSIQDNHQSMVLRYLLLVTLSEVMQ